MGKAFYVSGFKGDDGYVDHALKVNREGVNREGAEDTPKSGRFHRDAAIGLDSVDVHMGGDRAVVVAENPDGRGGIIQTVERYSDRGKFLGSHEIVWEKTGERTHTIARSRRIFT